MRAKHNRVKMTKFRAAAAQKLREKMEKRQIQRHSPKGAQSLLGNSARILNRINFTLMGIMETALNCRPDLYVIMGVLFALMNRFV